MKRNKYYFVSKSFNKTINPAIWLYAYIECLFERRVVMVLPEQEKHPTLKLF